MHIPVQLSPLHSLPDALPLRRDCPRPCTRHLVRETGLTRGAKALLAMNQPDGFDCPGCAWPEPSAATRPRIEFCENGAKALAEEATTRRATPEVFA